MSKYYQALSKIQTQYNEKLQKEAKDKEASVFKNTVNDKLKSYSNMEKNRDTLETLRPLFILAGIVIIGIVFYVGVRQGMMIKKSQPAPEAAVEPIQNTETVPAAMIPAAPVVSEYDASGEIDLQTAEREVQVSLEETGLPAPAADAPAEMPAEEDKSGRPKGKYTLQLVTYADQAQAAEEVERLNKKGYHAFIIPSGRYNQICINGFEKAADCRGFQSELKQKGELGRYPGSYVREIPSL